MDADLQRDINSLLRKVNNLSKELKRGAKGDLADAAKIIVSAIKQNAPVGKKGSVKSVGGRKILYPRGNLKRSISVLRFRRAKLAVFVGPKATGGLPDGFYAPFLEFGTSNIPRGRHSFIAGAVARSKDDALAKAVRLLSSRVLGFVGKNSGNNSPATSSWYSKYAKAKGRQ